MKTYNILCEELFHQEMKSLIHPDYHKSARFFKSGKTSVADIKTKKTTDHDAKEKIHNHLTQNGYKYNPVLSDPSMQCYEHQSGKKMWVTQHKGRIVLDHE
jgi:hypothetical protein